MLLPPAFLLGVLSPRGRWDALAALSGPAGIAAEPARNFTAALTGSVAGTVSNAGTGNLLEGAHVELPTLGIVAVADRTGRFMLTGLPAGTHEIVASYTGLDPKRVTINVTLGEQAIRDFDLTASIEAKLWAAEPIFGNPVAFTMGEKGRVFVTETYRYRAGGALDLRDDHAPDNLQHRGRTLRPRLLFRHRSQRVLLRPYFHYPNT